MKHAQRATLGVALAAVLAATVTGTSVAAARTAAASGPSIAFVGADLPDPFYLTMKCGAFAAAKQYKVNLSWQGTNGVDFAPELTIFNATRQKKPDGIILAPFSPTAFISPVASTMKAGIPVVTVDGSLNKKVELQNIRTDNIKSGGFAATGLAKVLGGKGKVAVVSFSPDIPVQKDRVDGFKQLLAKKYPGIKVVSVVYGGADAGKSATATSALLQANPDLNGIYATDTNDADGAASAIQAAGQRGKIKLVSYDATPQAVQGLKTGLFDGIVSQAPYDEGFQAVRTLALVLSGKLSKSKVPYMLKTGGAYIDSANVHSASVKKYLYRPTCS
jgi:ribose transport system substrate-binding protein